ncbi:MAG: pyruvoyl-dependent arginine decarboxylase [Planctomycetes bacterium SM23_25]|nr:MAG: pyruvoyl-dependent arginine decarboxylase [Planctomycetes bacterium SM23_25]
MVPKYVFFTKGVGVHREKLASFEAALRNAGIEKFNVVRVSSIFPPGCKILSRRRGLERLWPGQIVFCVMAEAATNEPGRQMAASVGLAAPADGEQYGYLSEHHSFGQTDETAGDYAEDLAATMLATTLGLEFNPESAYDERKEIYRMSGKIVRSQNVTQSARCNKDGLWTTCIACAAFVGHTPVTIA